MIILLPPHIPWQSVYNINTNLSWKNHDLLIMQKFDDLYHNTFERRDLAMRYVELLHNKDIKTSLRRYVAWNLFKKHVRKNDNIGKKFSFEKNLSKEQTLFEKIRQFIKELFLITTF